MSIRNTEQYVPKIIMSSSPGLSRNTQVGIRQARRKTAIELSAKNIFEGESIWIGEPKAATWSRWRRSKPRSDEQASGTRPIAGNAYLLTTP